jgi:tetratricopeptide (TPR) repeat protein
MKRWNMGKASIGMVLCLAWAHPTFAQQEAEREKIRQIEMEKQAQQQRQLRAQLDSAVLLTDAGLYAAADAKYLAVLKGMRSIPSDLTYHFGRNSFHLQKYSQSVDWLNKYIQLKGTTGQHYEDALAWLKKAEQMVLAEKQQQAEAAGEILSRDFEIDCGPTGRVVCPVCNGSTVVIRKTYLGESYKTCGYCSKNGYLNCSEYNQLLRGELKPGSN